MKTFGLSLLAALIGYVVGLFGGMGLVNLLSSNTFDRSLEAAMTGAFVVGPLVAVLAFLATLVYLIVRNRTSM
jgi:hypothetical protein